MNASPALASFRRWRPLLDGLAAEIHPLLWKAAGVDETAAVKLTFNPRARRLLSLRPDWLTRSEPGGEGEPARLARLRGKQEAKVEKS